MFFFFFSNNDVVREKNACAVVVHGLSKKFNIYLNGDCSLAFNHALTKLKLLTELQNFALQKIKLIFDPYSFSNLQRELCTVHLMVSGKKLISKCWTSLIYQELFLLL